MRAAFVGRVRELATLDDARRAAADGAGRVVLLVGEPGIGKTRLAEEFARRAGEGAEILAGRCFEGPGAPPFWPWSQIVRAYAGVRDAATLAAELGSGAADVAAVVPELRALLPQVGPPPQVGLEQARFRVFDALTRALVSAATRRPIVIVLDDLHGADPSSLLLLQFLARRLRTSRVLVLGTLRPAALAPGHPLADAFGELAREQASEHLDLAGLAVDEVAELITEMAGAAVARALVETVQARTEGNPLYVTEIARTLLARKGDVDAAAAMPATVRMAIGRHVGALSAGTRETLTIAAVFGREFRLEPVARASGVSFATTLTHGEEAVASRIVAPGAAEGYRFVHALFGETLAETLGGARRIALHRAVARALVDDPRADDLLPEIAHHWLAAGDAAEAVAWARRAGDRASAVLAYEEAADWYRRALAALGWMERPDPAVEAELLLGLGDALKRSGARADAKDAFVRAAGLARTLGSAALLTRAALGYAPPVAWGDHAAADPAVVGLLEEAIAAWDGEDASLHALALAHLAMVLLLGEAKRRSALARGGLEMARRAGDETALRAALASWLGSYEDRADWRRRLALATELTHLAQLAGDLEQLAVGHLWRCVHLLECGDVAAAAESVDALAAVAAELRQPLWGWYVRMQRIAHQILAGRFAEARRAAQETYEEARPILPFGARAYFVVKMMCIGLLEGRAVDAAGYRAVYENHPDPASLSPLAWVACEEGDYDEARAIVRRLTADDCALVRRSILPQITAVCLIEACAMLQEVHGAAALEAVLAPNARDWLIWAEAIPLGPVAHSLGLLARTTGRLDEAVDHFEFAIAEARRVAARPFLARSLFELAVTLRTRNRPDDTSRLAALLQEAGALAADVGMHGLVRRIASWVSAEVPGPLIMHNVFRQDGDRWLIAYVGTTIMLRDARGLRHLATLVRNPGRQFHVNELVGNLPEALAEAERDGDLTRAERARVTVTKSIAAALTRIGTKHPELAAHLRATVRRGYYCAYVPDPRHPIAWEG